MNHHQPLNKVITTAMTLQWNDGSLADSFRAAWRNAAHIFHTFGPDPRLSFYDFAFPRNPLTKIAKNKKNPLKRIRMHFLSIMPRQQHITSHPLVEIAADRLLDIPVMYWLELCCVRVHTNVAWHPPLTAFCRSVRDNNSHLSRIPATIIRPRKWNTTSPEKEGQQQQQQQLKKKEEETTPKKEEEVTAFVLWNGSLSGCHWNGQNTHTHEREREREESDT